VDQSPIAAGTGPCGPGRTFYRFYRQGEFNPYQEFTGYWLPLSLKGPDGEYIVEYYSLDSLNNDEREWYSPPTPVRKIFWLHNTAPSTSLSIGNPVYIAGENTYVLGNTPLSLTVTQSGIDVPCGTLYRFYLSGDPVPGYTSYSSPFFLTGPEGEYKVEYYSLDALNNVESAQVRNLVLDNNASVIAPGDANEDNTINMGDATRVMRIILGLDQSTLSADANRDGQINMGDVTKIMLIILGLG